MTGLRVLVVEDDDLIGMLLAEILTQAGYDVDAVEVTEAGAVAAAARRKPELMIVDIGLRNGSGFAAVEGILRAGFIPHLFISGDISEIHALKPAAVVIQKPFREGDLARAIDRALAVTPSP